MTHSKDQPPVIPAHPNLAQPTVTVIGAGITGLWQALLLARAGHTVHLVERADKAHPFAAAASRYAGAMLSPQCEAEAAPPLIRQQGLAALAMWRAVYPDLIQRGSLVLAQPRDRRELTRFARMTQGHETLGPAALGGLEPDLAGRFETALYYPEEAHMPAPDALAFLLEAVRAAGAQVSFGVEMCPPACTGDVVVDCRGWAAAGDMPVLRGVRGERIVVQARDVALSRPVRLLHPRVPLYIVPWPGGLFMIGATVIESSEPGPITVRSALELLGAAFAVHPGFAEAAILEASAGVRPALPDNIPRAVVETGGRIIRVNGAYRHGFLLAPMLAQAVCDHLTGAPNHPLLVHG